MFPPETRILIVDDMMTMRKLMAKSLKDLGYSQFVEAPDGQKAWEILNDVTQTVQLVVSDWNMPNCSGLDLLKRVRKDSRLAKLPFILVTAESEQSQVIEAVKAGVNGYVVKPFTTDAIKARFTDVHSKLK
jgi:two-component system, chemotaxis family, chemotaxis protein CheY